MNLEKRLRLSVIFVFAMLLTMSLSTNAFASAKVLGNLHTASINVTDSVVSINLNDNVSCSLPDYSTYYIQERKSINDITAIHIFGFNDAGLDFEIILDTFKMSGDEDSYLEYVGLNLLVDKSISNIIKSEPLTISGLTGFDLLLNGNSFNGKAIPGNFEVVLLSDGTTCISVVIVGHQKNEDIQVKILTELLNTIKMKQNNL